MADLPSFDELPDHSAAPPMSFDDLPDHAPAVAAPKAAPISQAPMAFDSLPDHSPPVPSSAVPSGQVRALSPVAQQYLQNHPATSFSLDASPIASGQLAKTGTVGTAVEHSDREREAEQMKNSAMGFFNARIKQLFLDPEFLHLSKEEQDHIINAQIDQWEGSGLPAGKFNGANPNAFKGIQGEVSPRDAWTTYANDIRAKGIQGAQEPGAIFKDNGRLIVAKAPTMLGSETLGATGVAGARAIPGIFGGNLAGEAGAALGGSIAGTPGAIIGGIGGSLAGAFGADKAITEYANRSDNEAFRNGLESLDDAVAMGEQEHPIASAFGRAGAQAAQNRTGLLDLIAGKGLTPALAPRLTGGLIGGGIEGASEAGRGEDFDPYKIGEAALSGTVFSKPRFIGEGPVPMSYEGRHWADTNTPAPELYSHIDSMLRNGAAPADVFKSMGNSLPDTPENRRALRVVSADIRHGRDPAQSMENVTFRPNGLSVDKTVDAVNEHIKDWKDAPSVQVHDSYDSDTIPANMKDQVGPGTLGWKDADGVIHIVASQHADPAAVTATLYHEGMHAGLARAYQGGLEDHLVQLYDNANPRLRDALTKAEAEQSKSRTDWKQMTESQQKALVTDEVLAGTAENGIYKNDFDKISSYIRNFGRAHLGELGSRIKYSDAEVRQIMSTGYDAISKGEGATTGPLRYMNIGDNDNRSKYEPVFKRAANENENEYGFNNGIVQVPEAHNPNLDIAAGPRKGANQGYTEFPQTERNFNTIEHPDGGGRTKTLPNPDDLSDHHFGTREVLTRLDGKEGDMPVTTYTDEEAHQLIRDRLGLDLPAPKTFDELPDQTPRVQSEALDHPEGKKPNNTIPNPDSIDWSKTRFSRKYSGAFGKDYDSRQERTEDLVSGHFGNAVYKNVRGMMRPLEEYKGLTQDDIKNAAQELKDQGFNAEIAIAQGAIPDNAAYVVALKDLVNEKLSAASEIAGRYRATGGMRHERELMRSVTELGQVMSVFDKTASNLGRMLHALKLRIDEAPDAGLQRMLDSIRFANGKLDTEALDQIAKALVSKDPLAIRKSIDRFDPNWKKYGQSLFYNFILGSKSVQLGNIMGNATHIAQRGLGDIIGYGVGLGQEGAFRAGDKLGLDVSAPDRMHSDELMNRMSGLLAGLMNKETYNSHRAFNTAAKEFFVKAGENEHENKFASQAIPNLPPSIGLEYGTRGLQAADAFFRTVIEHSAMQGLATREARRLNNGERPSVEQIADVMASPTREMLSKVKAEADRLVFQEDPPKQAEWFGKIMRSVPGGWLLAPIIRTPANIGRTAFETFDPSGRITQRNRDALKAGGPEANRVRGNQILAAALWAGALYLIKNDMLNGGGPANPQARAQWLMSHQPYSIGSAEDGFFPLRGISPIGDGLSMIADIKGAAKYGSDPDTSGADKALMIASAMTDAYLSNSFLSPVTDGLQRGAKPTIQNLLGTLVQSAASIPVVSQYKKEKDPFVRDTSNEGSLAPSMADKASLMDDPLMEHYFQSVKPRASLPVRRDPFGDPVMADNPTSVDPVAREVGRLVESTGKAVMPSFSRVIKGTHVPNDMYNSFLTIAGPAMHQVITEVMQSPEYKKTLDDEQRAALLRNASKVKGLHARLNAQLAQMMLDRDPSFEDKFIPKDLKTISQIPGEN